MKSKTYYYKSYTDDFAVTKDIHPISIDDNYVYEPKNPFFKIYSFLVYFLLAKPIAWTILKVRYGYHVKNKKVLKECKHKGYFLYGNHTNYMPDAFVSNVISPRRNSIIVGNQTVSIKGIQTTVKALGAIPLGDTFKAKKNFMKCVNHKIEKKQSVMIFPEAHIWPYYTGVRPFDPSTLKYPTMLNTPVYTISLCYSKRKMINRPKITAYIDGPFYPDNNLGNKEKIDKLYNEVYNTMVNRCKEYSTYSIHQYIKQES